MASFKVLVEQDMNNVLFNIDEFAEVHKINNRNLTILVDNEALKERSKKEFDGLSIGELLYFVRASEFGELPEEGTPQIFDGKMMYVFNAREESGIYEIILQQNRGE